MVTQDLRAAAKDGSGFREKFSATKISTNTSLKSAEKRVLQLLNSILRQNQQNVKKRALRFVLITQEQE